MSLKKRHKRIIAIDPGLSGTGVCEMIGRFVVSYDVIRVSKPLLKSNDSERIESITSQLADWIRFVYSKKTPYKISHVLLEVPEYWGGSAVSHAATVRGDLLKLGMLCGSINHALIMLLPGVPIRFVKPREWKGQLTKNMVDIRVVDALGESYPNHALDAVGMIVLTENMI